MNVTNMVQGNLALKLETPAEPTFTVVQGGRSGFQPLTVKPARNQQAVVAPARVALKVPTIVAVALTLFFVLAMSVFSARHAAYAESVSNITYGTIRVQPGDSLWSLAEEYPIEGLSTQETSDMIRSVNHLEHGSLAAGAHLKVPARS
ncbi:LysM peptidoglycan-binding domain-containing protein [Collinsella sp. AF20-14LB]|uniref:LysM peptidoglycan-binding domain-containing protein n=1 Tax=Collinsella sp. AF20-14LB TaxID=2292221 RepID=UPI001314C16B|nr:LysM peptidoglycan-binding domain-containing protein [Collinsella sp. AF20-14LB]